VAPGNEARSGGDIRLGGLFKGLGDFVDLLADLAAKGETLRNGSGEIEGLPRGMKGVYGFSVRTGLGGVPQVHKFGNVHATDRGPVVDDVREPMVDVFDEEDVIIVLAEMPGVGRADVEIEINGDVLSIATAAGAPRKYAAEVLLPAPVQSDGMKMALKNGVLELRLTKAPKAKGKRDATPRKRGRGRARAKRQGTSSP
jgi:HSP20 family protein